MGPQHMLLGELKGGGGAGAADGEWAGWALGYRDRTPSPTPNQNRDPIDRCMRTTVEGDHGFRGGGSEELGPSVVLAAGVTCP